MKIGFNEEERLLTEDELNASYDVFAQAHGKYGSDTYHLYRKIVGMKKDEYYTVSKEGYENVKKLLSPHGHTLAKAWIARRG